jgi:hypothetical protein
MLTVASGQAGSRVVGQDPNAASTTATAGNSIASDLFQFPPTTPSALVDAASVTLKLGRVADSKAFLRKLLDLQLGDNELLALRDEIGPSTFLDFRRDARLLPEAQQLLVAVNNAKKANTFTADQLQGFAQQLGTPGSVGSTAAAALVESGIDAIPVLLAADAQSPSGRVADAILKRHARSLRYGLLQQMAAADSSTRVRLLRLLGSTADSDMVLRLLRWQFDPAGEPEVSQAAREAILRLSDSRIEVGSSMEAAALLREQAESLLTSADSRFSQIEQPEAVRALTGRNSRGELVAEAQTLMADVAILDPDHEMTKALSAIVLAAAVDPRLNQEASVAGEMTSEDLLFNLFHALRLQQPVAAIEFLRGLRQVDSENVDRIRASEVFRDAILSPDARVRFLAAYLSRKHLHLEISESAVSRTLESAQSGSLKPEVVIVSGDDNELRSLQQVFQDAGSSPQIAETGPDGFDLAVRQMNCELFVVNVEAPLWPISTTLANLRADIRTRHTPVVVIGPERWRTAVTALAETYHGVWFVVQPAGTQSLLAKLTQKSLPPKVLTPEDRAEMYRLAQ